MQTGNQGAGAAGSQDKINFSLLRQHYQKQFIKYFEDRPGNKTLFMDETILKVLAFVIGVPPESAKVKQKVKLSDRYVITPDHPIVVFIVRPDLEQLKKIIYQRNMWQGQEKDIHILFIPRRTIECDELLLKEKFNFEDKISQINMDLIPLDDDLLSLEQPDNFLHHMLQDDDSYKVYVQYSIHRLESVYGKINYKFGFGKNSKQIISRIESNTLNIDQSQGNSTYQNQESEIDAMFMIDRDVDLISPFCVSQSYEGLLDEFFGIKTCSLSVDNKIVYPDPAVRLELKLKDNDTHEFDLTDNVPMFAEIRNKHFNSAGPHLNRQLADIQTMMEDRNQKNIQELDQFIKKLKNMNIVKAKEIATEHINIAFNISQSQRNLDYIQVYSIEAKCIMGEDPKDIAQLLEAKMIKQYNKLKILRALCLFSLTQGGLTQKDFDNLRRVFIMNYGYQETVTLMNMQDAGLIKVKDRKDTWKWENIKSLFNLVSEDEQDFMNPTDYSYVFSGYAPISIRLIQMILQSGGVKNLMDEKKGHLQCLGLTYDKLRVPNNESKFFNPEGSQPGMMGRPTFKKRKVLIYFLGGINYAEIAAIRFLQKLFPMYRFIIATTSIINGESALRQMMGPGTEAHEQGLLAGEILRN